MTQVWPGFGEAPVPTVVSIICKPEAVVMVFPGVWANAVAGTNAAAANIAATIEIITRWRRRIRHLPLNRSGRCLAQQGWRGQPRGRTQTCRQPDLVHAPALRTSTSRWRTMISGSCSSSWVSSERAASRAFGRDALEAWKNQNGAAANGMRGAL